MNVLGLKYIGHDTGAALISDGRVMAISEERLNRVKHATVVVNKFSIFTFPELSINYCLENFKLKPENVDFVIADSVRYPKHFTKVKGEYERRIKSMFPNAEFRLVNHHDLHAASAFFCSPFEEAAVLVYDGFGEEFVNRFEVKVCETETTYFGKGNALFEINKTVHKLGTGRRNIFTDTVGVGKFYSKICESYLGLGRFNEGKMMGLAPYGDDSVLKKFPFDRWFKEDRGEIFCNAKILYELPPFLSDVKRILKKPSLSKFFKVSAYRIRRRLIEIFKKTRWAAEIFFLGRKIGKSLLFDEIVLPRPPRDKSTKLPDGYYSSVAYAAQKILEEISLRITKRLHSITHSENIAISGGVGLNIDANRKILDESGFKHIFIQPAASDAGIPLGAALYGWHVILGRPRFFNMDNAYLGREYSGEIVRKSLEKRKSEISFSKSRNLVEDVAKLIAEGKIVGWFQGGSEYGPRALGHRSILCDARRSDMKDVVNERVKHREMWRPFAASVLKERVNDFFDLKEESPFMILLGHVSIAKRDKIPSVVHVDGTCRVQTVTKKANGVYYDLIAKFYELTGVPLILNTSFNLAGEPIVETPRDALNSFLSTDMDFLVIGDYLIKKSPLKSFKRIG